MAKQVGVVLGVIIIIPLRLSDSQPCCMYQELDRSSQQWWRWLPLHRKKNTTKHNSGLKTHHFSEASHQTLHLAKVRISLQWTNLEKGLGFLYIQCSSMQHKAHAQPEVKRLAAKCLSSAICVSPLQFAIHAPQSATRTIRDTA